MLKCVIGVCICLHASAHSIDGAGHSMFLGCLSVCDCVCLRMCIRVWAEAFPEVAIDFYY